MNGTTRRALILAPHCDDAEFGLGIAIQRLIEDGVHVTVNVFAYGDYARGDGAEVEGRTRTQESDSALEFLGVSEHRHRFVFKENAGLETPFAELVATVEQMVRQSRATEVYVCLPSFNQDHRAVHDATVTAFRPGAQTASLYAYEYPGNCWGPELPAGGKRYVRGQPRHLARKIEALKMHRSQFDGRQAGVSPQAAYRLARQRGAECGAEAAELVYVLKEVV